MANKDYDLIKKGNAGEIGRRIMDLERKAQTIKQSSKTNIPPQFFYAKVDKNNNDGTYDLTEQIINSTNTDWEEGRCR
jgi:hypothetical protein